MDLTLNTARVQERAVLEVGGEVDMYSSPTLRERIAELLDSGESVLVVDLSGTSFLDSTGLGALVAGLNHAKQVDGWLSFAIAAAAITCTRKGANPPTRDEMRQMIATAHPVA